MTIAKNTVLHWTAIQTNNKYIKNNFIGHISLCVLKPTLSKRRKELESLDAHGTMTHKHIFFLHAYIKSYIEWYSHLSAAVMIVENIKEITRVKI